MRHTNKKRKSFSASLLSHMKGIFLFCIGGFFLITGVTLLWASFIKLPDFSSFHDRKVAESTKIYDRTGEILLYDVHQNIKRTLVPFENISPWVKDAVVAIEDTEFYKHTGVSLRGLTRAIVYRGTKGGGSTITQQVIKKTLLTDEKLIARKLKEIILSFKLEQTFTKEEILALYLNEIPYGGSIYGIGEASRTFFGILAKDITLAQSAYLAAIPNAPTYYSPYGNHKNELDTRKNLVLSRMFELGFIDDKEYQDALVEKVEFLPKEPTGIKAPHFVEMIKEYLVGKYGERAVLENGYKVITTLDYNLQQKAEGYITKYTQKMEEEYGATNMAFVAIDPKNGQLLALVGSRNYFDVKNEGNFNVALAHRQPGSSFKPFAYATAFKKGYTPETVLFDLPTNFSTECDAKGFPLTPNIKKEDCYTPENYEGGYRGPLSMRDSLAQSRNITSVKTLYLAGLSDTIKTAKQMGIMSLEDTSRFGLSLVLGGGEVSLFDITGAYGVFANDGMRNPTQSILKVEDRFGKTLEEFKNSSEEVLSSEVARKINSILSDNKARTPTFGANSSLHFPGKDVAVKTGTTNDFRDVWTVGYTPTIAVGMWAGNNDNSSIKKGNSAAYTVSVVWHAFMEDVLKTRPQERFVEPEKEDLTALPAPLAGVWRGGEKYIIDKSSGALAVDATPEEMRSIVVVPEVHSILYWIDKDTPRGPRPTSPENDPQFALWEEPVRNWVATQNIVEGDRSAIPTTYDTSHSPEASPIITVDGLDFSKTHTIDELLTMVVSSSGRYPISSVEFYVNDHLIEKKQQSPFIFTIKPSSVSQLTTDNAVSFIVYDSILNKSVYTNQLHIE